MLSRITNYNLFYYEMFEQYILFKKLLKSLHYRILNNSIHTKLMIFYHFLNIDKIYIYHLWNAFQNFIIDKYQILVSKQKSLTHHNQLLHSSSSIIFHGITYALEYEIYHAILLHVKILSRSMTMENYSRNVSVCYDASDNA